MKAGIQKKLNEQINKELVSAYLYLDFANYFGMEGWTDLSIISAYKRWKNAITL